MYGKFVRSRILSCTPCTPRGKNIYTSVHVLYRSLCCLLRLHVPNAASASSVVYRSPLLCSFFVWMGVP